MVLLLRPMERYHEFFPSPRQAFFFRFLTMTIEKTFSTSFNNSPLPMPLSIRNMCILTAWPEIFCMEIPGSGQDKFAKNAFHS